MVLLHFHGFCDGTGAARLAAEIRVKGEDYQLPKVCNAAMVEGFAVHTNWEKM